MVLHVIPSVVFNETVLTREAAPDGVLFCYVVPKATDWVKLRLVKEALASQWKRSRPGGALDGMKEEKTELCIGQT